MTETSSGMLTRRSFLQTASAGCAALALAPATSPAAEPVTRSGDPLLKLSLAAYSFNKQLGRGQKQGTMTLLDFIDYCAAMNLPATELTSYYFPEPVTPEYLMEVKARTFHLGLDISGTAIGNDFCLPPGEDRQRQLQMCHDWIDHAAAMGAPVIRIFAGKVPKGGTEEEALDRCVEGINESLKYAESKGVVLALENHGGITATPEQLLAIVERVDSSPFFGVNFDSGNFRTEDPYGDLEKIAPYAVNAQVKVAIAGPDGKKTRTDFDRVIKILKDAGYRGYVALEYEENDPRTEIPQYLDTLRKLIG